MNSNIIYILAAIALISISSVSAQTKLKDKQVLDGKQRMKYELAIDIKNVEIFSGRLGSPNLMLKIGHKKDGQFDRNKIYNYRIFGRLNSQADFKGKPSLEELREESILNEGFDQNDAGDLAVPGNYFDISLGFGFETQKETKHIIFYQGIDFIYDFIYYDDDFIFNRELSGIGFDILSSADRQYNYHQFHLHPFFGIRYFFGERLSLALETGFDLAIFYGKSKIYDSELSQTSYGINSGLDNIRFLNLSYMF